MRAGADDYWIESIDRGIIGVRSDYVIQVRADVIEEEDGPMLKYGLQSLHNSQLMLPTRTRDKPAKLALDQRYQRFIQ